MAFTAQQLLLREFLVSFEENTLFVATFLGLWLVLGGLGGFLAGRHTGKPPQSVAPQLLLQAAWTLAALVGCRLATPALNRTISVTGLAGLTVVLAGPASILSGLLFGRLARGREAGAATWVLVLECLGSVAGVGLVHLARTRLVSPIHLATALIFITCSWAAALALCEAGRGLRHRLAGGVVLLACVGPLACGFLPAGASFLESWSLARAWRPLDVLLSLDSPYGRITLVEASDGNRLLMVNRFPMYSLAQDAAHNEGLVHLPLLLHPDPRRVLLIGGGVGGAARETLEHPVEEVILCELDPAILAIGRWIFPERTRAAFADRRFLPVAVDGARFVSETPIEFDAILLDLPDPYNLQLARFYTREFFERARTRLRPGGMLVVQFPHLREPPEAFEVNRHLLATLRSVFPRTLTLCGRMDYIVGVAGDVAPSPSDLPRRFRARGLETEFLDLDWLVKNIDPKHRAWRLGYLESPPAAGTALSTEDRPYALALDLVFWGAIGHRGAGTLARALGRGEPWQVLLVVGLLCFAGLVLLDRSAGRAPARAGAGGLASMGLQIVLLYLLQLRMGSLVFVAPLCAALAIGGHALGAAGPVLGLIRIVPSSGLLMGLAVTGALAPGLLLAVSPAWAWVPGAAGVLLVGAWTGALFPALLREEKTAVAAQVYGADLLGAAAAAFVVTPVVLPLGGCVTTGVLLAMLTLAALGVTRHRAGVWRSATPTGS